ncbi:MAG: ArnT family glycosyltransferase [Planctomycetota bacterium]
MKTTCKELLALLAIVAFAFVLRVRGLLHQLPHWTYLDGYVELVQAQYLRAPESVQWPDMNLGYYPYLTSAAAAVLPDVDASGGGSDALEAALAAAREPWVRIRLAASLLSLGAVVGAWALARRFVSAPFVLLAAALVATSLVHVTYSSEQRPHGPTSGMVTLALWALVAWRERSNARSGSVAALTVTLAIAALQSSFALLVPAVLAWWLRERRGSVTRELGLGIAGLTILAIGIRLAYPFHFDDRAGAAGEYDTGAETMWMGGHALYTERFHGRGFGVMLNTFLGFDPWLLALAALGALMLGMAISNRRIDRDVEARSAAWIVLGYAVPFVLVFGVYDMTYDRFVLPLVPLLAILAVWAAQRAWNSLGERWRGSASGALLALIVLAPSLAAAWHLGTLREREDTFESAARWLEQNAKPGEDRILLLQNIDLPLAYSRDSLATLNDSQTLFWTSFQRTLPPELHSSESFHIARPPRKSDEEEADAEYLTPRRLRESGFRYVVSMPPRRGGVNDAETVESLKALRKGLQKVATFAPAGEDERRARAPDFGFGVTESSTLWNLLSIRAFGPRIEIFEL